LKFQIFRLAAAAILKYRKLTYLPVVKAISTKFGTVTLFVFLDGSDRSKCTILKIQDGGCRRLGYLTTV